MIHREFAVSMLYVSVVSLSKATCWCTREWLDVTSHTILRIPACMSEIIQISRPDSSN
jgi:hypothetical protein